MGARGVVYQGAVYGGAIGSSPEKEIFSLEIACFGAVFLKIGVTIISVLTPDFGNSSSAHL